jgi:transcriptional regulator GlxA family with amidase domain
MSYEFVMSLAREAEESLRTPGSRLERARAMLLQSRGGPLGVKEVAAQMGLSREHFTRCFLKHFGESPGNLLRTARLQHAKSLLRQSSLGLEEIASLSGFGSAAALSHAFRGEVGVAPGEWRGNTQSRNRISRTMRGPKRA